MDVLELNNVVRKANAKFEKVSQEIGKVVVGQAHLVQSLLIGLLADGHILLEGLPGLAKTLTVNSLAKVLQCEFQRIQFTPDLLPSDLTGTMIYNPKEGTFTIRKGPVFTNIVIADEINRAPPKVQSALLEVMQEKQVTLGNETFSTGTPFLVLATQNPIEQEGTYVLPEAQTDRFMMKVRVDYPSREDERIILKRMGRMGEKPTLLPVMSGEEILEARKIVDAIYIDDKVMEYLLDVVFATRNPKGYKVDIEGLLEFGASPRASIHLLLAAKAHAFLDNRGYVTPHDVKSVGYDVLRHRLRRTYEAEAENLTPDAILARVFDALLVP